METKKKFFIPKGYRLPLLLLACIVVGAVLGLTLGEKILWVKPIGTIFVNLCFTIAVPTVMFSIISSVARIQTVGPLGEDPAYHASDLCHHRYCRWHSHDRLLSGREPRQGN